MGGTILMRRYLTILFLVFSFVGFAQPPGYTEGTNATYNILGVNCGYNRPVGWTNTDDDLLVFLAGDNTTISSFNNQSPGLQYRDAGINYNGTRTVGGVTRKLMILVIFHFDGNNIPAYAAIIDFFLANHSPSLTSMPKARMHIGGLSGGVGRGLSFLTNDQSHNSPNRDNFGKGIWLSGPHVSHLAPSVTTDTNYVWYGTSDTNPGTPPDASVNIYTNLPGVAGVEKFIGFTTGGNHGETTWSDFFKTTPTADRFDWLINTNPGGAPPAPQAYRIAPTSANSIALMGGTRGGSRVPFALFDGDTDTQVHNSGGAGDQIYYPNEMLYIFDSAYDDVKFRLWSGIGSPTVTVILFSELFTDSLIITKSIGTFPPDWNWMDTLITQAWGHSMRFMKVLMPSGIHLGEMEVWGINNGETPAQYFPNSTTIFNTPFVEFHGENVNGDEKDSLLMSANVIRANNQTWISDTATIEVGVTHGNHRFVYNIFGATADILERWKDSGLRVFTYSQGASAANMPIPRPYVPTEDAFAYYGPYNHWKNIPTGSDSTNRFNWRDEAKWHASYLLRFGPPNPGVNTTGYENDIIVGRPLTTGLNYIFATEAGNEDMADFFTIERYHSPQVIMNKMWAVFDSSKAKCPTCPVLQGAMTFPDTNNIKAMWYFSYRARGFDSYPADVILWNHYITDIGGQSQVPTFGVSPELKSTMEEAEAFVRLVRKYLGAKQVWWTEVGWDASPNSSYRAALIGSKSRRRVAADWLGRIYVQYRAVGGDAIFHYRLRDETNDLTSAGAFATMGLATGFNANSDSAWKRWPGSYMMSTQKAVYFRYSGPPQTLIHGDSTGVWLHRDNPQGEDSVVTLTAYMGTSDDSDTTFTYNAGQAISQAWRINVYYGPNDLNTGKKYGDTVEIDIVDDSLLVLEDIGETMSFIQFVYGEAQHAPIAYAGGDISITLPVDSAFLNGEGSSDIDGTIVSYSWAKISGPSSFEIANPTDAFTWVYELEEGVYEFELTVTDNDGLTDTDIVVVTVTASPPANIDPVAFAGNDQEVQLGVGPATIILNGSASNDPDGTISTYAWTKISGPSCTINSPSAAITSVSGMGTGTYLFRLVVTDDDAATDDDTVQVIITDPPINQQPVAVVGDDQVIYPGNTVVDASGSFDPDGTIVTYLWEKVSGPGNPSIVSPTSPITQITGLIQPGNYTFIMSVTDNNGGFDNGDKITITVVPAPFIRWRYKFKN